MNFFDSFIRKVMLPDIIHRTAPSSESVKKEINFHIQNEQSCGALKKWSRKV